QELNELTASAPTTRIQEPAVPPPPPVAAKVPEIPATRIRPRPLPKNSGTITTIRPERSAPVHREPEPIPRAVSVARATPQPTPASEGLSDEERRRREITRRAVEKLRGPGMIR